MECKEYLCQLCNKDHLRVKTQKVHTIKEIISILSPPPGGSPGQVASPSLGMGMVSEQVHNISHGVGLEGGGGGMWSVANSPMQEGVSEPLTLVRDTPVHEEGQLPPILEETGTLYWPWTGTVMSALLGKDKPILTKKFSVIVQLVPQELPDVSSPSGRQEWDQLWLLVDAHTPRLPENTMPTHPNGVSAEQGLSLYIYIHTYIC